jgi:hypothetical protein
MNVLPARGAAPLPGSKARGVRPRPGTTGISVATLPGMLILLLGVLLVACTPPKPQESGQQAVGSANTTVDYTSPILKLDPSAIGMDISGYGYPSVFANDEVEQQKLQALGIKFMRIDLKYTIPGDPTSKLVCGAYGCDTRWTGDQWIGAIKAIGAQPLIIVPPSAADAAHMVGHFNRDSRNPVHFWIVGNEPDQAGVSAAAYSANFNQVYDAMKAIDPTIKVGGGATAGYDAPFLQAFLQRSGSRVDFVDFHQYAQEGNAPGDYAGLFRTADDYGANVNNLRSLIQRTLPARASHIGIEVGEWELNWGGTAQNNANFHAVWVASVLGNILKAGGWSLFYADKGNAIYGNPHTFTDPYGHVVSVNPDDTNPAYHGIGMFTGEGLFRGFGSTVVSASTTLPNVEVFASDDSKNIVVINQDQSATRTATFSLKGMVSGTIAVWRKDEGVPFPDPPRQLGTLPLENGTFTYQLPPFSVTTFVLYTARETPPAPSPSAAAPSPTPAVTLARDTFQRANQTYWGTASDGQRWGGDANSSQVFSIAGGSGQLANDSHSYSAVLGPPARNAEVLFSGSLSSFNYANIGAVLRWADDNDWYKAYIDGANLAIERKAHGLTTTLIEVPFAAQAGISYTLRFSAVGSTLSAKAWRTGSAEPRYLMATTTDSLFQAGRCGLHVLVQVGTVAQISAFAAWAL